MSPANSAHLRFAAELRRDASLWLQPQVPCDSSPANISDWHNTSFPAQVNCFARSKEHGISGPQYNVLRILRVHGTVSVYRIAGEMVTPSPDMPRLVDRLEAAQLVTKTRCENDRRVVWVNLTKDGKALLKQLEQPLTDLHKSQLGHLSESELKTLSALLYRARRPEIS